MNNPDASSSRNTILLQCIAALLIANSHLEAYYPRAWMAADGLLGNTLFFFLSGYGLVKSEQKKKRSFPDYYGRRLLRIYPAVLLVVAVIFVGCMGGWRSWNLRDYVTHAIYPTDYAYIRLIVVFYVPFFFLMRIRSSWVLRGTAAALLIPFVVRYVVVLPAGGIVHLHLGATDGWLWTIFYFQAMLIGGAYGILGRDTHAEIRPWKIFTLAAALVTYVGMKFAMVVSGTYLPGTSIPLGNFYFLLLILTLVIIALLSEVATSEHIRRSIGRWTLANWAIALIGVLTLEIYLTHEHIATYLSRANLPFPLNIGVWLVLTIVVSWLLQKTAEHLKRAASGAFNSFFPKPKVLPQ